MSDEDFIPSYSFEKTRRWWRMFYTGLGLGARHVQTWDVTFASKWKWRCTNSSLCVKVFGGEGWKGITLKLYSSGARFKEWSHLKAMKSAVQAEPLKVTALTSQTQDKALQPAKAAWRVTSCHITSFVKSHLRRWKRTTLVDMHGR